MRITGISNLSFTKLPKKILKIKKQTVNIYNPKPNPDGEKILVIMKERPFDITANQMPYNQNINIMPINTDEE